MEVFISAIVLIFFITNLIGLSYFILNKNNDFITGISTHLLFGLSILILFSHFTFFLFDISSQQILVIYLIISTTLTVNSLINKKKFFNYIKNILYVSLPIVFIFLLLAYFFGEQFYVFRGNKWDWFAFVTSTFYINNLESFDYLNLKNNFDWSNFENYSYEENSAYHNNVVVWLLRAVNIYLLGSFFLDLKFNSPFFNLYLFKVFCLVVINLSTIDFLKKYITVKTTNHLYLFSLIFIFSFWILYLVEADYYRQLISFGLFIYLLSHLDEVYSYFEKKNYKNIIIIVTFFYTLFLIYPELLFVYLLILLVNFIFYNKKIYFLKKNYLYFLVIIIGLFPIIFTSYDLITSQIIGQLRSTTGELGGGLILVHFYLEKVAQHWT